MSDIMVAEGFGYLADGLYSSGDDRMNGYWGYWTNSFDIADIGDGRKYMQGNGAELDVYMAPWEPVSEFFVAFRIYRVNDQTAYILKPYGTGGEAGRIGIDSTGHMFWDTYGVRRATATVAVPLNIWTHVEFRVKIHNTDGEVDIYINGVLDASETAVDTREASDDCQTFLWWCEGVTGRFPSNWRIADLVIHQRSGPIGDCGVFYCPPTSDGSDQDLTPSSGSDHFAMVDEIGADENTTYNESDGTPGDRDDYAHSTTLTLQSVVAVCAYARLEKTAMGGAAFMLGIEHDTAEAQSGSLILFEDYKNFHHIEETNPSTASVWEVDEAEEALVSIEVV